MKAKIVLKSFPGHKGIPGHQGGSLPENAGSETPRDAYNRTHPNGNDAGFRQWLPKQSGKNVPYGSSWKPSTSATDVKITWSKTSAGGGAAYTQANVHIDDKIGDIELVAAFVTGNKPYAYWTVKNANTGLDHFKKEDYNISRQELQQKAIDFIVAKYKIAVS